MRSLHSYYLAFSLFAFLVLVISCNKDTYSTNPVPQKVELDFPSYFPSPYYNFTINKLSNQRINLGKALFYDPILSSDSTISCASCHKQSEAFSDANHPVSIGVNHAVGTRNSPAIFNMIWNSSFMWDGGINHIEIMPFAPLTVANEMNEDMNHIISKLERNPKYKNLFREAFGVESITSTQLFYSLAQFMGTIISANSKYDEMKKGNLVYTKDEQSGYQLFLTHCNQCHTEPMFTNYSFQNNGIDSIFDDKGRQRITLESSDLGKFKVPTLRNLSFTPPYMHNGSLLTIDDVIQHYSDQIINTPTVSTSLSDGFHFSTLQKMQLKKFLATLDDYTLLTNKELSTN